MQFPPPSWSPPTEPGRANRPVAAWLAIAGSSLLLVAAIVVVASRWQQIPQSLRFTGLLTALVLIAALAEQIRRSAPTTARVVAHLVPAIAVTVGIAAGATATQPWPVCIVIGGLLGAVTTEVQKRRWASPRMAIIAATGVILAACGVAAETGVPATLIAAGSACALMLFGRKLEAMTMACAVGASSVLATLTTLKFGDGTMARIGAAGAAVAWSAPIAGLVAAGVLGAVAHRQRSMVWAGAAVACGGLNIVTGLAVGRAAPSLWACVIPSLVIAVEVGAEAATGVWRDITARASRHIARPAAYLASTFAVVVIAFWSVQFAELSSWSLPLALSALATAAIGARRLLSTAWVADTAIAASIGCSVASVAALALPSLAVSGMAIGGLVFCFRMRRPTLLTASLVSFAYLAVTLLQRTPRPASLGDGNGDRSGADHRRQSALRRHATARDKWQELCNPGRDRSHRCGCRARGTRLSTVHRHRRRGHRRLVRHHSPTAARDGRRGDDRGVGAPAARRPSLAGSGRGRAVRRSRSRRTKVAVAAGRRRAFNSWLQHGLRFGSPAPRPTPWRVG